MPSILSLAAPASTAGQSPLVAVAPAAIVLAVVLVLLTAVCTVALVIEIRRDGYGLERPRVLSEDSPWQVSWQPRRHRSARAWGTRRPAGVVRR